MSVVIQEYIHDLSRSEAGGIAVNPDTQAPGDTVNLGVLNIMPEADQYETELINAFARISQPVRFIWIRVRNHGYRSTSPQALEHYRFFEEVVDQLDGLIVTGAPVERLPFHEVRYWEEIRAILQQARSCIKTTLGICWGGLAMGHILGIRKEVFSKKLFGVFPVENLHPGHKLTGSLGARFTCPVSTHAGISDKAWEQAEREGKVTLLAHSREAGYLMAESRDGRFLMHFGHPEYGPSRLPEEYARDCSRGVKVDRPNNVDLDQPLHEWKPESDQFLETWARTMAESKKTRFHR